jgi:hypothetical protein
MITKRATVVNPDLRVCRENQPTPEALKAAARKVLTDWEKQKPE